MSESRRLGQRWRDPELVVIVDMYFNGHLTDSHGHDEIARCLGRFNPDTNSYNDGGVNQKLAEIKGYVEGTRQARHPGTGILALVDRYRNDLPALRVAAVVAWRDTLTSYTGQLPRYVQDVLA
jgi:hypothetical protein